MSNNRLITIVLILLSLMLPTSSAIAQPNDNISFGIRLIKAYEGRPETFSYFSYELPPGAVLTDEALVMNSGDVLIDLILYPADGISTIKGGTAFANPGEESTGNSGGVSRWLSPSVTNNCLESPRFESWAEGLGIFEMKGRY